MNPEAGDRPRRPEGHRFLRTCLLLALPALCGCAVGAGDLTATISAGTERPRALRGAFQRELLLTGELEAVRAVTISAPQTSIFQMRIQFMAEEGSFVKRGDPLLDFDNSDLADRVLELETQILDAETQVVAKEAETQSALKDLEIELASKQYEYERARLDASIEEGVLSRKDYSERQLAFSKAEREFEETRERIDSTRERGQADLDVLIIQRDKMRHDYESARQDMELLSVKAPSDGLVIYQKRWGSKTRFQEGDSCWPGQGIMRLPDLTEMQVAFHVNEVDARLLQVGMPVQITMDSFPERMLSGTVLQIPSMAVNREDDSKVRIFKVIAALSETLEEVMKPGMSVLGRVVVDRRENVPMVDRRAVRFDGERYWLQPRDQALKAGPIEIHPVARDALYYVLDEESDGEALAALGLDAEERATVKAAEIREPAPVGEGGLP